MIEFAGSTIAEFLGRGCEEKSRCGPMSWLITGGCGFVGCNLADALLQQGRSVTLLDDLSRRGARRNLLWLRARHGADWPFCPIDIRDERAVARIVREVRPSHLAHLAGQVAMTTSLADPRRDFEINALGTLNVLEAVRLGSPETAVYFSFDEQGLRGARRRCGTAKRRRATRCPIIPGVSTNRCRSTAAPPTAARSSAASNTAAIITASSACGRSCSAIRRCTADGNSPPPIRAGSVGFASKRSAARPAARSRS